MRLQEKFNKKINIRILEVVLGESNFVQVTTPCYKTEQDIAKLGEILRNCTK